jgi:RHS repeat-associated protein
MPGIRLASGPRSRSHPPPFPPYNRSHMQTDFHSAIPDASLAVFPVNGENSHQGFAGRNPAPHPVREACKFTVLLGLRGQAELNRIGSRSTGKERDQESGNDYFGARYYASSMGRFLTPDWSKNPEAVPYADLENPQTLNLYSYAENNPLIHIDADGHCSPQWLCNFFIDLKNQALYGEWTTNTAQAQIHQIDQQEAQNRAASLWQEQHPHQLYPGSIQQDIVFPIGLEGLGGITAEEVPGRGTGTDPSTPIGRRGNPIDVTPGTNSPEVIGGRKFTGHALDQMQGRGIPSSVVEEVITNGTPGPGNDPGTFTHTGDGVQVVTNSTGDVVTVKTVSR